jgi:hypothetical protein
VRLIHQSEAIHLGYFDCLEEAKAARLAANAKLGYYHRHGAAPRAEESVAPATDKRSALTVQSVADDFRGLMPTENVEVDN